MGTPTLPFLPGFCSLELPALGTLLADAGCKPSFSSGGKPFTTQRKSLGVYFLSNVQEIVGCFLYPKALLVGKQQQEAGSSHVTRAEERGRSPLGSTAHVHTAWPSPPDLLNVDSLMGAHGIAGDRRPRRPRKGYGCLTPRCSSYFRSCRPALNLAHGDGNVPVGSISGRGDSDSGLSHASHSRTSPTFSFSRHIWKAAQEAVYPAGCGHPGMGWTVCEPRENPEGLAPHRSVSSWAHPVGN